MARLSNWLMVKGLIFALRKFKKILEKFNKKQRLGLCADEILDKRFGSTKSEKIQTEIIKIMEEIIEILKRIINQLKEDRGE